MLFGGAGPGQRRLIVIILCTASKIKWPVYLSDTNGESWHDVHRFLAPALSPKAVQHYAPQMQNTAEQSFKVFDKFESKRDMECLSVHVQDGIDCNWQVCTGNGLTSLRLDRRPAPHHLVRIVGENPELIKRVSTIGD